MKIYLAIILNILIFAIYFPDAFASEGHSGHEKHEKEEAGQVFPEPFEIYKPAPDFTLTDQNGKKVALKDFRGKVVLINFIYTSCGETCPVIITKLEDVQKTMKEKMDKEVILISITIDPERDTSKALKAYAKKHGAKQGWFFLTGTRAEIDRVLNDYGIIYKKDEKGNIGHVNLIILIDKQGVQAYNFGGVSYPSKQIIDKIKGLLAKK